MKVFLCYRRQDSPVIVDRVAERLRSRLGPQNVFKDVDSISYGKNFLDEIQAALTAADVLLVVIGPRWLNISSRRGRRLIDDPDDWVRIEVREALQRDDVRVVPLVVGGATMPGENELPPGLKALAYRNARILRTGAAFEADLDTFVERLSQSTDKKSGATKPKSAAKPVDEEKKSKASDLVKAGKLIEELLKPPQPEDYLKGSTSLSVKYSKGWYKGCQSLSGMVPDSPHREDLLKAPPDDDWANDQIREEMIATLKQILKWEC